LQKKVLMDLSTLQKKYPRFVYESYGWNIENGDFVADFCFEMGEIKFNPRITIRGVDRNRIEKIGEAGVSNLVFNMGLAEIPSYWKATCAPVIEVKAGYLDKTQIKFWQDLIEKGMGQFFFENKLPFIRPKFIVGAPKPEKPSIIKNKFSPRYLVPLGGGKDSLVTLELLREAKEETTTFVLNPNEPMRRILEVAGGKNIIIERKIDRKLIELKDQGYLNGHTPFSSILSFLSVAVAALFDFRYIAISQERSSDEGNIEYLGQTVNHQYSKSFEFENKFRGYCKKYLAKDVEYFSFLRPLYEIQIAKLFSRYPKYFSYFMSCNKSYTIAAREGGTDIGWCGQCPKCLSTFVMLYPFVGETQTAKIFGENLFNDKTLLPIMSELLGEGKCKPFECVATFAEARSAFYLSWQQAASSKPYLLAYFETHILPKYPKISRQTANLLASWNPKNNLPKPLQNFFRSSS